MADMMLDPYDQTSSYAMDYTLNAPPGSMPSHLGSGMAPAHYYHHHHTLDLSMRNPHHMPHHHGNMMPPASAIYNGTVMKIYFASFTEILQTIDARVFWS